MSPLKVRQIEEEKPRLGDHILALVLDYEVVEWELDLVRSQLKAYEIECQVYRVWYRYGGGSMVELMGLKEKGERLLETLTEAGLKKEELLTGLLILIKPTRSISSVRNLHAERGILIISIDSLNFIVLNGLKIKKKISLFPIFFKKIVDKKALILCK